MKDQLDSWQAVPYAVLPDPTERRYGNFSRHPLRVAEVARIAFVINIAIRAIQVTTAGNLEDKRRDGNTIGRGRARIPLLEVRNHVNGSSVREMEIIHSRLEGTPPVAFIMTSRMSQGLSAV